MKTLLAIVIMAIGLSLFAVVAQLPKSNDSYAGYWVEVDGVLVFFSKDEVIKTK